MPRQTVSPVNVHTLGWDILNCIFEFSSQFAQRIGRICTKTFFQRLVIVKPKPAGYWQVEGPAGNDDASSAPPRTRRGGGSLRGNRPPPRDPSSSQRQCHLLLRKPFAFDPSHGFSNFATPRIKGFCVVVYAQILSAYFVVLPLRDEGAISLGLDTLPGLFAGSLLLTVLAAPVASLVFSLPSIPKPRVCATSLS